MGGKTAKPTQRITGFTGLANHAAGDHDGRVIVQEFDGYKLRRIWHHGEWWHSVVDVVGVLTESADARNYWKVLKKRLLDEGGDQSVTNCNQLKLPAADGKSYKTDCATTKDMLRIVQSIPSKRAEPIKQFLAEAGARRLEETANPSVAIDRAIERYRILGRDEEWIDHRVQNISARNELVDEWSGRGVPKSKHATITNEMSAVAMGIQPQYHARKKGVPRSELREHMDKTELALTTLSETAAKEIMRARDTRDLDTSRTASLDGAHIAKGAREKLEEALGRPIASKRNFLPKPDGSDTPLLSRGND